MPLHDCRKSLNLSDLTNDDLRIVAIVSDDGSHQRVGILNPGRSSH